MALVLCAFVAAPAVAEGDRTPAAEAAPSAAPATDAPQDRSPQEAQGAEAPPAATTAETATTAAADMASQPPAEPAPEPSPMPAAAVPAADVASEPDTTASADTKAAAAAAPSDGGPLDAAPAEADPLTPPADDTGPARAPGAPETHTVASADTATDPFITALRTRLDGWPESRAKADQDDLSALKSYYGENGAARLWTMADGLSPRAEAVLAAFTRADDWGLDASAFEPPSRPESGALAEALVDVEVRFGLEVLKYARHARGGRINPSSVSAIIDMKPRLYEPRSIIEAIAQAPKADVYLEGLHPRHAGFVALKGALAKARAPGPDESGAGSKQAKAPKLSSDERRIIANMERWRWLPDDLGAFHLWDNVPEQVARVIHDGKVIHQAKIVVGKPATPTPVFSMPMRFVIFHPTWGVPDGIKSNEIGPMLRRAQARSSGWFFSENDGASRALQRHQLRVYSGGREINPDSVNWGATDVRRFSFIQPASRSNVLGLVKFRFPNKHDVYMHDTSERHLFSRTSRAFSHGCMRVEDPLKLAELILAYDKGWSRSRIDQIIARGATHDVTLEKKVNVHIAYFTATVDANGKLRSHPDIYGLDSRTASALAGRSVVLSSAKADEEVKPTPVRARPARASSAPRRKQAAAEPPAAPKRWSPFNANVGN